jgi:hypothetical protein
MRRFLACASAVLLLLAACGDDDTAATGDATGPAADTTDAAESGDATADDAGTDDGEEPSPDTTEPGDDGRAAGDGSAEPYIDALEPGIAESGLATGEDARCIAGAVIETIGVDRLEEEGVDPDDLAGSAELSELGLDEEDLDADTLAGELGACDLSGFVSAAVAASGDVTLSQESIDCVGQEIDQEPVSRGLAGGIAGGDTEEFEAEFGRALAEAMSQCPEAIADLVVGGFEEQLEGELSSEARDCVAAEVSTTDLEAAMVAVFEGEQGPFEEVIIQTMGRCPEILVEVFLSGVTEADAEVSDEALDCIGQAVEQESERISELIAGGEPGAVEEVQELLVDECGAELGQGS